MNLSVTYCLQEHSYVNCTPCNWIKFKMYIFVSYDQRFALPISFMLQWGSFNSSFLFSFFPAGDVIFGACSLFYNKCKLALSSRELICIIPLVWPPVKYTSSLTVGQSR